MHDKAEASGNTVWSGMTPKGGVCFPIPRESNSHGSASHAGSTARLSWGRLRRQSVCLCFVYLTAWGQAVENSSACSQYLTCSLVCLSSMFRTSSRRQSCLLLLHCVNSVSITTSFGDGRVSIPDTGRCSSLHHWASPVHPPTQKVPRLLPRLWSRQDVNLTTDLHLVPRLRMREPVLRLGYTCSWVVIK
jgi:hypothetical protein